MRPALLAQCIPYAPRGALPSGRRLRGPHSPILRQGLESRVVRVESLPPRHKELLQKPWARAEWVLEFRSNDVSLRLSGGAVFHFHLDDAPLVHLTLECVKASQRDLWKVAINKAFNDLAWCHQNSRVNLPADSAPFVIPQEPSHAGEPASGCRKQGALAHQGPAGKEVRRHASPDERSV